MDVAYPDGRLHWLCDKVSDSRLFVAVRFHRRPLSVKWVGFFVTAVVGLYTIEDLWDKFGNLRMSTVRQQRISTTILQ